MKVYGKDIDIWKTIMRQGMGSSTVRLRKKKLKCTALFYKSSSATVKPAEMEDSENLISFGYVWKSGGISFTQVQWVSVKIG